MSPGKASLPSQTSIPVLMVTVPMVPTTSVATATVAMVKPSAARPRLSSLSCMICLPTTLIILRECSSQSLCLSVSVSDLPCHEFNEHVCVCVRACVRACVCCVMLCCVVVVVVVCVLCVVLLLLLLLLLLCKCICV